MAFIHFPWIINDTCGLQMLFYFAAKLKPHFLTLLVKVGVTRENNAGTVLFV